MKCTINSVRNIKLSGNRFGSRVEGFLPINADIIPDSIFTWMRNYAGIRVVCCQDGLLLTSWATTTCSERDAYDENIGAHIAESKSKTKIYRFLKNFAQEMSDYFCNLSSDFNDAFLKYDHCVDHEEEHIQFLGNKNNED